MKVVILGFEKDDEVGAEIIENKFLVDGYSFGDRLLEGVMFEVEFNKSTGKIINVVVEKSHAAYFSSLNSKKWIEEAKRYANSILGDGDEVDVPQFIKDKYPQFEAFCIEPREEVKKPMKHILPIKINVK